MQDTEKLRRPKRRIKTFIKRELINRPSLLITTAGINSDTMRHIADLVKLNCHMIGRIKILLQLYHVIPIKACIGVISYGITAMQVGKLLNQLMRVLNIHNSISCSLKNR